MKPELQSRIQYGHSLGEEIDPFLFNEVIKFFTAFQEPYKEQVPYADDT